MRQFCIFSIVFCAFAYGQHFQTRFQGAGLDSYEANTPVGPSGITAGQSDSYPAAGFGPRVLLTRFNGVGGFNWNRVYPNLPNQFADYEAVDIKPVAASGGLVAGYYVVGHFRRVVSTTPIANRDLFLTRITNNGIVIWHRELATVPAPAIGDAEAVSVEVLADNSAVVVGNLIPFSGIGTSVIVSRVTPTGTTMF